MVCGVDQTATEVKYSRDRDRAYLTHTQSTQSRP